MPLAAVRTPRRLRQPGLPARSPPAQPRSTSATQRWPAAVTPAVQRQQPRAEVVAARVAAAQRRARLHQRQQVAPPALAHASGARSAAAASRGLAPSSSISPAQRGDAPVDIQRGRARPAVRAPAPARPAVAGRASAASACPLRPRRPAPAPARTVRPALISARARRLQPLALRPQPVGDAGSNAAGAAGALVGRGLRNGHGFQPREAGVRVEPRFARQARSRPPRGCPARSRWTRPRWSPAPPAAALRRSPARQRRLLRRQRQVAMQGQHVARRPVPALRASTRLHARDFAPAGQEHQHVAVVLRQRLPRTRGAQVLRHASCARAGGCSMRTGKLRPGLDRRGASSHRATRSPSSVADITSRRRSGRSCACTSSASAAPRSPARCRSWNSSKMIAPTPVSSGSSCSRRVRMPSVTTSMRVPRRHLRLEADAVADRLAPPLSPRCRAMNLRGSARRDPPRLQHHDLAAGQPRRVEQCQRHLRGLARARWRLQHQPRMRSQCSADPWQQRRDGKPGHRWMITARAQHPRALHPAGGFPGTSRRLLQCAGARRRAGRPAERPASATWPPPRIAAPTCGRCRRRWHP